MYLIVGVEHMSAWRVARDSIFVDSVVAVSFIKQEILSTFGLFSCVVSYGTHFSAAYVEDFAQASGFKWKVVSPYNP